MLFWNLCQILDLYVIKWDSVNIYSNKQYVVPMSVNVVAELDFTGGDCVVDTA